MADITTCPICLCDFVNPKSLPCLHTFCLKCIAECCKDKPPETEMDCPICRSKFKIPEQGVEGLPHNFFLDSQLEEKKALNRIITDAPCEVCCTNGGEEAADLPPATMYCVDCCQKLCKECSRPCLRWRAGPHTVLTLGVDIKAEMLQLRKNDCDKHKGKPIELYCFDCKETICMKCFAVKHQQHKCHEIEHVAEDFAKQVDSEVQPIIARIEEFRNESARLDKERDEFEQHIPAVRKTIIDRGDEVKRLVDQQVADQLDELERSRSETCKAIEMHKEMADMTLMSMESFKTYALELKAKGQPSDLMRAAERLHERAEELKAKSVTSAEYCAPVAAFDVLHLDEIMAGRKNLIGCVGLGEKPKVLPDAVDPALAPDPAAAPTV